MKLKTSELEAFSIGSKHSKPVLFQDKNGDDVRAGDMVEFSVPGNVFPHSGYVENHNGLRVACYDNVFDRWVYYDVDTK